MFDGPTLAELAHAGGLGVLEVYSHLWLYAVPKLGWNVVERAAGIIHCEQAIAVGLDVGELYVGLLGVGTSEQQHGRNNSEHGF